MTQNSVMLFPQMGIYALAFIMVLQSFMMPIMYLDFKLRQDYIAKVLCINRSQPELQCKGQCFLMKKIKQAQQEEEAAQNSRTELVWLHTSVSSAYDANPADTSAGTYFNTYQNLYSFRFSASFFHPPHLS